MRVFVDTNVLLDMICQREGFKEDADTIFRYCIEDKLKIVMSALTLINANYTAHKYGYSWDELLEVLKRICGYVEISTIDDGIFMNALYSNSSDLEDAVQYYSAKMSGADYIITRDVKGFVNSTITVLTLKTFYLFFNRRFSVEFPYSTDLIFHACLAPSRI